MLFRPSSVQVGNCADPSTSRVQPGYSFATPVRCVDACRRYVKVRAESGSSECRLKQAPEVLGRSSFGAPPSASWESCEEAQRGARETGCGGSLMCF